MGGVGDLQFRVCAGYCSVLGTAEGWSAAGTELQDLTMATEKTKGGIQDLKAFLNEVIEDINEEDDRSVISESGKKNGNESKDIDMDELKKIRKEISESIKDLDGTKKQSEISTYDETDTLDRIDEMINSGNPEPEVTKVLEKKEAAMIVDTVDNRVEVVEVFEEKLIAKLGSKADYTAESYEIDGGVEGKDSIVDSQIKKAMISEPDVNKDLSKNV